MRRRVISSGTSVQQTAPKYMSSGSVKLAETVLAQFTLQFLAEEFGSEADCPVLQSLMDGYMDIWHVQQQHTTVLDRNLVSSTSESCWHFLQLNIGSPWQESGQGFCCNSGSTLPSKFAGTRQRYFR